MSEPKPNRIGLFLLLVAVIVLIGGANAWKTSLKVRRIEVQGIRLVQKNEVLQLAQIALNTPMYNADLTTIQRNVMSHHYVKDVTVERDLPGTLRVTVRERIPVAIVSREEAVYLDDEGIVLPRSISRTLFDLPVISGVSGSAQMPFGSRLQLADVNEALLILTALKILNREVYHNISEIQLRGSGDMVLYSAEKGIPILFGRGDVASKLVRLEAFWKNVVRERGTRDLQYVDLRYDNQVVVRWNGDENTRL
jgi:cell division protein FtsQ